MAQAALALEFETTSLDREDGFRRAQAIAFRHMASGWYGPNFRRTVKEGVESLLDACEAYVDSGC